MVGATTVATAVFGSILYTLLRITGVIFPDVGSTLFVSKVAYRFPLAANSVAEKTFEVPSGLLVMCEGNGKTGIPVGPTSVAAPVAGLTL